MRLQYQRAGRIASGKGGDQIRAAGVDGLNSELSAPRSKETSQKVDQRFFCMVAPAGDELH